MMTTMNPIISAKHKMLTAKIDEYSKEKKPDLRLLSEILLDGQKLLKESSPTFAETYHHKCHDLYKQMALNNHMVGIMDFKKTILDILFTEYQYVYCGCTTKQGHYCLNGAITSDRGYVCRVHKKQRKRQGVKKFLQYSIQYYYSKTVK